MPTAAGMAVAARLPWRWNGKRRRRGDRTEEEKEKRDILSPLPDSVIGHVFSFLSIKDILRTTAVSKRWKSLWTNTTTISHASRSEIESPDDFLLFCSSLHRVFSRCNLARFMIGGIVYRARRGTVLDSWLSSAVAHRLPDITLDIVHAWNCEGPYLLPEFFFAYPCIVSLRLQTCDFTLCRGVSWSLLKFLRVGDVEMTDCLLDVVLNGCPSLERLELVRCWGMNHIRLHSMKLRELAIAGYCDPRYYRIWLLEGEVLGDDLTLVVSAPHLLSLDILDDWYGKRVIRIHQVSSLEKVTLDFKLSSREAPSDFLIDNLIPLVEALSSVDKLMLGIGTMAMLATRMLSLERTAVRLKCRTLKLGGFTWGSEFLGHVHLLGCTGHVEKLVIYYSGSIWPNRNVPYSFGWAFFNWLKSPQDHWSNHLKTIEINGFRSGTSSDFMMIVFLLREAVVLEKMVINVQASTMPKRGWKVWEMDVLASVRNALNLFPLSETEKMPKCFNSDLISF